MTFQEEQLTKRASGRSTRLLQEIIKNLLANKSVCVVAKVLNPIKHTVQEVCPNASVKYFDNIPDDFDWYKMRSDKYPDYIWLIDHYSVECNVMFQNMLEQITRFDSIKP